MTNKKFDPQREQEKNLTLLAVAALLGIVGWIMFIVSVFSRNTLSPNTRMLLGVFSLLLLLVTGAVYASSDL